MGGNVLAAIQIRPQGRAVVCVVVVGRRVVVVVLVCLFLLFAALIFLSWQKSPGIQKDLVGQYNKNFSNFTVSR